MSRSTGKQKAISFFDLKASDKDGFDLLEEINLKRNYIDHLCSTNTFYSKYYNLRKTKVIREENIRKPNKNTKSKMELCYSVKEHAPHHEQQSISDSSKTNICIENINRSAVSQRPEKVVENLKKSLFCKDGHKVKKGPLIILETSDKKRTINNCDPPEENSQTELKPKMDTTRLLKEIERKHTPIQANTVSSSKNKTLQNATNHQRFLNFKIESKCSFTPLGKLKIKKPVFITQAGESSSKSNLKTSLNKFFIDQDLHSDREHRNLKYQSNYKLKYHDDVQSNYVPNSHTTETEANSNQTKASISKVFKTKTISNLKKLISNFSKIQVNLQKNETRINNSYWQYPEKQSKSSDGKIENSKKEKKQRNLQNDDGEYDFLEFLEVKAREPEIVDKYLVEKVKLNNSSFQNHNFISNNVARAVTYGSIVSKMDNLKAHQMGKTINENYSKYAKDLQPKSLVRTTIENVAKLKTEYIENVASNYDKERMLTLNMIKKGRELMKMKDI